MTNPLIEVSASQTPNAYHTKLNIHIEKWSGDTADFLQAWDETSFGVWQDLMNQSLTGLSKIDQRTVSRQLSQELPFEKWKDNVKDLLVKGLPLEMTIVRDEKNKISVETRLEGQMIKKVEPRLAAKVSQDQAKPTLPPIALTKQYKESLAHEKSLSRSSTASTSSSLSEDSKGSFTPSPPETPAPSSRFRRG